MLNFISFIPRSKLESETLNQIDTSFLTPVYSRQHPPNRALEDSRERRWCWPVFKKRRGALLNGSLRMGAMVRIEFRAARVFIDFLGFLVYYPAFFKTLKARLVRNCSLCSLPVHWLPSTTWGRDLSEDMAEFPGPAIVHNTCVLNLCPLISVRVDSCSSEWVQHTLAWSVPGCEYWLMITSGDVAHIGSLLGYTEVGRSLECALWIHHSCYNSLLCANMVLLPQVSSGRLVYQGPCEWLCWNSRYWRVLDIS